MSVRLVHNVEIIAGNIRAMGGGMRKYMQTVLTEAMTEDVMPRWTEHITRQALSPQERRSLDYPWSTRHGKDSGPYPDTDIGEDTGSIVSSTTIESGDVAGNPSVRMINTSSHYEYIRYGTHSMRPRDPAGEAMGEALPAIQTRFSEEVQAGAIHLFAE